MNMFSALFVLFVGLKLANIIDWSWWWVSAPIWGGVLLVFLAIGIKLILGK